MSLGQPKAGSFWFRAQGDAAEQLEHASVHVRGVHPLSAAFGDSAALMVWFTLVGHGERVYSLDVATFMEDFIELLGVDT